MEISEKTPRAGGKQLPLPPKIHWFTEVKGGLCGTLSPGFPVPLHDFISRNQQAGRSTEYWQTPIFLFPCVMRVARLQVAAPELAGAARAPELWDGQPWQRWRRPGAAPRAVGADAAAGGAEVPHPPSSFLVTPSALICPGAEGVMVARPPQSCNPSPQERF